MNEIEHHQNRRYPQRPSTDKKQRVAKGINRDARKTTRELARQGH